MNNRAVADRQNIAADERIRGKKENLISIEFQKFVFKSFVDKTNYKVVDENGTTIHLRHSDRESVVIDLSKDDYRLTVYRRAVMKTLEKLESEIANPNLEKKVKDVMVSLKSSLEDLQRLEIDNMHLVYDNNDFDKEHNVELNIGDYIMKFKTPFVHLVEVTMESDKKQLEKKLKQVIKQLIFIMEYSTQFFAIFEESFSILYSIKRSKLNIYALSLLATSLKNLNLTKY